MLILTPVRQQKRRRQETLLFPGPSLLTGGLHYRCQSPHGRITTAVHPLLLLESLQQIESTVQLQISTKIGGRTPRFGVLLLFFRFITRAIVLALQALLHVGPLVLQKHFVVLPTVDDVVFQSKVLAFGQGLVAGGTGEAV